MATSSIAYCCIKGAICDLKNFLLGKYVKHDNYEKHTCYPWSQQKCIKWLGKLPFNLICKFVFGWNCIHFIGVLRKTFYGHFMDFFFFFRKLFELAKLKCRGDVCW